MSYPSIVRHRKEELMQLRESGFTFAGRKHTEETRRKLSLLAMGNKRCIDRPISKKLTRDIKGRFVNIENLELCERGVK